jgi:hypothetical protein
MSDATGRHVYFPKGSDFSQRGGKSEHFAYKFTFNPLSLFLLIFLEYPE